MTPTLDVADRSRLEERLHRATGWLRAHGLSAGDRLGTALGNDVDAFAFGWACALAGVVEVPVPVRATQTEATELLADADVRLLAARPTAGHGTRLAALALDRRVVEVDLEDAPRADPDDAWPRTRAMAYTSGTTGRRKGVTVGVHDAAWGEAVLRDEHTAFGERHGERHLVVSPLYHSGPFRHALVTGTLGGSVGVLGAFDAGAWLHALRTFRPTSLFCVPTHLHRLLADPDLRPDDLASLTLLLHAGAPCPVPLKERLLDLAPEGAVWEFYGSTEGQFTVCPPDVWSQAPGSVGVPRPGRSISVRDGDGRPTRAGEVGTVWVEVPDHARWSYWGRPDATAAAWDGDAFTVGDLGASQAGVLTLAGRPGDLVITGGVNVYPAEVERVLLHLPGVGEAVVFGVPDDEWGQRLVAAVVPTHDAPSPDPAHLRELLRRDLSPARVPRDVLVVDDLPRTPTGKVRRADLPGLVTP